MKKLKSILKNENGNMMVLLAISMVALLGAVALVVDIGRLYHEKSVLQNAVDAAALGGAQGLLTGESEAASIAKDLASKNSYSITDSNLNITSNSVKVSRETTVPMTFAKVLGINDAKVSASAKAEASFIKSARGIAPIAIDDDLLPGGANYTVETPLMCTKTENDNNGNTGGNENNGNNGNNGGKHGPGNCGFLAIGGNGANNLEHNIIHGSTDPISEGSTVTTEPGNNWGKVSSGINTLINNDLGKAHCQGPDTADDSCDRVITIVIIPTWDGTNGRDKVQVIGFASYWISSIGDSSEKGIKGYFKKMIAEGEIGGTGPGTLYGVKLVE